MFVFVCDIFIRLKHFLESQCILLHIQVEARELEFDYCLSSLEFLPNLSHMPKILKDKMPNTRRGKIVIPFSPILSFVKFCYHHDVPFSS